MPGPVLNNVPNRLILNVKLPIKNIWEKNCLHSLLTFLGGCPFWLLYEICVIFYIMSKQTVLCWKVCNYTNFSPPFLFLTLLDSPVRILWSLQNYFPQINNDDILPWYLYKKYVLYSYSYCRDAKQVFSRSGCFSKLTNGVK